MMIKLNSRNHTCRHYDAPFDIQRNFDDPCETMNVDEVVMHLMWIPALVTARFLGQFNFLKSEADEIFAIGCLKLTEVVASGRHPMNKIGAVVNVAVVRAVEDYCNNLNSIVKVCTTTRYENRKRGISTPSHQRMSHDMETCDDYTALIVEDACLALKLDFAKLTRKQRQQIWEILQ